MEDVIQIIGYVDSISKVYDDKDFLQIKVMTSDHHLPFITFEVEYDYFYSYLGNRMSPEMYIGNYVEMAINYVPFRSFKLIKFKLL